MEALLPILKDFGFPICLCIALLWAIRTQNGQLVKAYTDRIRALEGLVNDLREQVQALQVEIQRQNTDRLRESREYGHTLKDVATRYATTIRDHDQLMRETLPVMRRLTDAVADLLRHDYHPHHAPTKIPSSAEIPADPANRPTETVPARTHG